MPVTQPLILLDDVPPEADAPERPYSAPPVIGAGQRSRWRMAGVWSAVLIVVVIAFAESRAPRPARPSIVAATAAPGVAAPPAVPGSPGQATLNQGIIDQPKVRTLPEGEVVPVFRRPDHGFCGELELRIDGQPVPISLLVETSTHLLVTLEPPAHAASGPHSAELIAGSPAPKATGVCRDTPHHRRTIAVTVHI